MDACLHIYVSRDITSIALERTQICIITCLMSCCRSSTLTPPTAPSTSGSFTACSPSISPSSSFSASCSVYVFGRGGVAGVMFIDARYVPPLCSPSSPRTEMEDWEERLLGGTGLSSVISDRSISCSLRRSDTWTENRSNGKDTRR